jgi:chitodextrinase
LAASAVSPSRVTLNWSASSDNVAVTGYRIYRNGALLTALGNVTTYLDNTVSASTLYSYTVQAMDGAGNASGQSTALILTTPATVDTTAPSTPTGLSATAVSPSQINLSWQASTDNVAVTGYRVFRNGTVLATLGNVTTYQDTNLTAGITYIYTVRAIDAASNVSGLSAAASATTPGGPDTIAPTTPAGLTANAVTASQINLSWSASTDNVAVASYRVYRDGVFVAILANVTTYQDTGLTPSTIYSYNVDAVDAAGNASGLSPATTATTPTTVDTTAPSTPTDLSANAVSDSQINLSWTASTDNVAVTGYRITRNGTLLVTLGNVTTYQNTSLTGATTYTYRVRALDAAGNVSPQSTAASATTPATPDTIAPSTPAGLTANAVTASQINLSWSASTDNVAVTGYRIYRNNVFLIALGNVTTYQNTGLTASTTYTYNVDAIDAVGNASGISTAASATTQAAGSDTTTLAWDASTATNLSGYRIYYGTAPGTYFQSRGKGVDVGNVTTYTIAGLSSGTRYYFAATAYDTSNNESAFSNEVFKDMP